MRITAVSPGAVDYLLRGSDCAAHDQVASGTSRAAHRVSTTVGDAAGYLVRAAAQESAGVWFGAGLPMVGVAAGTAATEEQVRAVFGRLEHPTLVDEGGKAVSLGARPRTFRSRADRVAQAIAAEPDATEERREQIRAEVHARTRKAVAYYDFTFSPAKSVSVYWAALLDAGREVEAARVVAAHRAGVAAAMAFVERESASVRVGYHGTTVSGQSVGVYEQATGLVWIHWDHSTSRARQPQLHAHVTVLNRAVTASDGQIRALASRGFRGVKQAADAIYQQVSQHELATTNGVVFATRADGKAREIVGFTPQLLAAASSRATDVADRRTALVERFARSRGRAPSPAERKRLDQQAWRDTRQAKDHTTGPRAQLAAWATQMGRQLADQLAAADGAAAELARSGHPDQVGYAARTRHQVLRAAVAAVQQDYATWDVGNLTYRIADEQFRTLSVTERPEDLAAEVLRDGARYGIVAVSVRDVGTVPAALRRADGVSRFRLPHDTRYTTTAQLGAEAAIVARARTVGATTLRRAQVEQARAQLAAAGLSSDQQTAVLRILTSGRYGDVLIGPAGTGKSRTVGALARAWETHVGGRVLGLATSQIATQILIDDGLTALNTTAFRDRFVPDAHGRVHERLSARDLIVVDEAGMSGTDELDTISAVVAAAGAKLVYTGDHEQLTAVGAGGMLELLVRDAGAVELREIHRFTHAWERAASVRLRAGDPDVLAVYDAHGRIRGGTDEQMTAAAVRGYLADTLSGHRSLLVVRDNATAAQLSGQIRAELVAAGRVSAQVLGHDADGNSVGVGDLIQARRNDRRLRVEGPGMVTNREVYEVLGRDRSTRTLRVRDSRAVTAHLPDSYLAAHTTLAYAVTSYGAQGITVHSSHALVDHNTDRAGVYVPGTRGTRANTFYVVCRHDPDHHDPERVDRPAVAVLADSLTRPWDGREAAELARRAGDEASASLSWAGTQWDLLTADHTRTQVTDTLIDLFGAPTAHRVVDEPGYPRLVAAVRSMELAGHAPQAVLAEAITQGSLHDAHSITDVLRHRIRSREHSRTPERTVGTGDWTTYTARWGGPVGDYAGVLAAAATARQTALGERAAAAPPAWALDAPGLGSPPEDPAQRAEWVRRAGIVAAYRDLHAVPDTQPSLGAPPSRERAFHHTLWRQALAASGHPADTLDYATASDTELRQIRDTWRAAQAWAPPFVATDLRAAREDAEEYRRDAVIWRAGLDRHPPGSPERALADRDVAAAEHLAAVSAARVDALERVQAVRSDWLERHTELAERASFAGDELERRGLNRDTATPRGEQQHLFAVAPTDAPAKDVSSAPVRPRGEHAVPDGYTGYVTGTERAAERIGQQPALFDLAPSPDALAHVQPLHTETVDRHAPSASDDHTAIDSDTRGRARESLDQAARDDVLTVAQAGRTAAVIAALRAEIDARASAATSDRADVHPSLDESGTDLGAAAVDDADRDHVEYGAGLS